MIRVDFDPARIVALDPEFWARWQPRAAKAAQAVAEQVAAGEKPTFDDSVWSELKQWLFDEVFHGKCAYCDGKVTPQAFGDAEHWRPKGEVTAREGDRLERVERGGRPHPGYWWLAYEPMNLLPSCQRCNSGKGKNTQFPVEGKHAFEPSEAPALDDLDTVEEPLLLHPFRGEDPGRHLTTDPFGELKELNGSELGKTSIDVFDLNRGKLREDRFQRLQEADEAFPAAWAKVLAGVPIDEGMRLWTEERAPYAATIREFVAQQVKEAKERL